MRSSETNHRDPTLVTSVVTRETEERHTEERRGPWDERGRNWSHVAIGQVIRQLLEAGRSKEGIFPRGAKRTQPSQHPDLRRLVAEP